MFEGPSRRTSRKQTQNKTRIFIILSIIAYLIIGSIILLFVFTEVWNEFSVIKDDINKNSEDIQTLNASIQEVNETIQFYVPCLDFVCEEFPLLLEVVMIWQGCWDSANNTTPDGSPIISGVGENGQVYRVCVPSVNVTNIDGNMEWRDGDLLVFDGNVSMWLKTEGSRLCDEGAGLSLIIGTQSLRKLIAGSNVEIFDVNGTAYEIAVNSTIGDITLNNLDVSGTARNVLSNPGTDDTFDFRALTEGQGIAIAQSATALDISVDINLVTTSVLVTWLPADGVDPVSGDDFLPIREQYVQMSTSCPGGARAISCGQCFASEPSGPPNPPPGPPGPHPIDFTRPRTTITNEAFQVFTDRCICYFLVIAVRTGGVNTPVIFRASPMCLG